MKEVLFSHELRGRITDLEYSGLTREAIKQIYYEETGEELKVDFNIYHSKNYNKILNLGDNGFDGTIIHFYDKNKGVNQMYSIARGSEKREEENWRPEDWMYNLNAIFVGKNAGQYSDANRFDRHVIAIIEKRTKDSYIRLDKIGMGHSLGGNTKQIQQLNDQMYDKVYTINAAQPTVYQLAYVNKEFRRILFKHYKLDLDNFNEIYTIDPKALVQFAEQYYKNAGINIHRLVAEEDVLQAVVENIIGFVLVGHAEQIDTMKDFESIGNVLGEIQEKDIQAIRIFLAKYASHYNDKGFDGFVQAMTGIDLKLVDKILEINGIGDVPDILKMVGPMVEDMKNKIPELLSHLSVIHQNLDSILNVFVKHGYMNISQKKDVLNAIKGIENDLQHIMYSIGISSIVSKDKILLFIIYKIKSILDHVEVIKYNFSDFMDAINKSAHAHSITNLLNAIADEKEIEYKGTDIIVTVTSNGKKIKMNLSSAIRIYTKGMAIYDEKEEILRRMKVSFENVYLNDYERRKAELLEKISDMETYPGKYQYLLGNTTSYGANYITVIRSITVHEVIPPLPQSFLAVFEGMFKYYEQEIQLGGEKLGKIRKMIEDYFQYDHQLAQTIGIGG